MSVQREREQQRQEWQGDRGGRAYHLFGTHVMSLPKLAFAFLGAPVVWSVHFGLIYLVDTLSCTERWMGAGTAIVLLTIPFAAVSAFSGLLAWRGWQRSEPENEEEDEMFVDARGRERLLLAVGMAGAVLFTLLIVFEGLAPLATPLCGEARPT